MTDDTDIPEAPFPPDHWFGSFGEAHRESTLARPGWSLLARLADLYGRWLKHWKAA